MTDRELKNALRDAYSVEPSKREAAFIKKYEVRKLQIFEILKLEIKYMGVNSLIAGLLLLTLMIGLIHSGDTGLIWTVSGALPICSLIPFILMSKSERYGMNELEASTRFSLRFLRMVRMMILGVFSIVLISVAAVMLRMFMNQDIIRAMCFACIPYMLNVMGCIMITRRWHSKDSIYACVGITFISCFIPFAADRMNYLNTITPMVLIAVILFIIIVTVRESILYVREGENLSWNLC